MPFSFPIVVENEDKLEELDEEGVEDPEEGEVSPVGVVVVEEVEDEGLNIGGDVELDFNDGMLPFHHRTNGRQPSKTIETNGCLTPKPSKNR